MIKVKPLLFLFCLSFSSLLYAQLNELQQLEQGNEFYEQGNYPQAIASYSALVENGYLSEDLYFNLGNAFFKNRDNAKAILYYEKALKINPNSEDAQFNLAIANEKTVDKIEAIPELFIYRWWKAVYNALPADTWAILSVLSLLLGLLGFAMFKFIQAVALRKTGFSLLILGLSASLLCFFLAAQQKAYLLSENHAIIIEPTVNIISAPSDGSSQLFVLHEGTKVQIKDNSEDWLKVALPNGNEGWIRAEELAVI